MAMFSQEGVRLSESRDLAMSACVSCMHVRKVLQTASLSQAQGP